MKPCEIAVIVPVHNAAAFLTACTDAIAAQKFDGFRCILVEDGSTDDSPALCDAIAAGDQRFVALHQTNSGVCAARTAGVREGRALGAKWFALCGGDEQRAAAGLLPVRYLYRHCARRRARALQQQDPAKPRPSGRAAA